MQRGERCWNEEDALETEKDDDLLKVFFQLNFIDLRGGTEMKRENRLCWHGNEKGMFGWITLGQPVDFPFLWFSQTEQRISLFSLSSGSTTLKIENAL